MFFPDCWLVIGWWLDGDKNGCWWLIRGEAAAGGEEGCGCNQSKPQDLRPLHLKHTDSGEKQTKVLKKSFTKIKRNQTNAIRVRSPPTSSLKGWTENTRTAVDKILKSGPKSSKENQT